MLSASSGHLDAVSYLLDSGANIGAQNLDRNTALHMACLNCHDAMVALLLSKNAPLESVNIGKSTPLLVAVAEGDHHSSPSISDPPTCLVISTLTTASLNLCCLMFKNMMGCAWFYPNT